MMGDATKNLITNGRLIDAAEREYLKQMKRLKMSYEEFEKDFFDELRKNGE